MANTSDDNQGWSQLRHGAPLAVLVAAALYILYQLLPVLELIVLAALISLVLRTLLYWLYRLIKVRWLAVLILVSAIVSFSLIFVAVIIPNIIAEIQLLLSALPDYLTTLNTEIERLHQSYGITLNVSQGLEQLRNVANQLLSSIPVFLNQAFDLTLQSFATLILALYIAYDPDAIVHGVSRLIPRRHHPRFNRLLRAARTRLRGWIFGTGIAMLFLGIGAAIGLWLIGIPLALSFAVIAGLFEVIPYFGSIVGTVLPALVALTLSPTKFVLVLVLFLTLNQIDAHLVQPLVMGREVKLHPVMVIVTFLTMGKLLGLIGVILAVPIAAVIVTLFDEFLTPEASLANQPKEANSNQT